MEDHVCFGLACAEECCTSPSSFPPQTCDVFECPLGSTKKDDMEDHVCTGLACAEECCTGPSSFPPQTCDVFECPRGSTKKDGMGNHVCTGLACAEECCTEDEPQKEEVPPPSCPPSIIKKCMSSEQPVEASNPESQVFMVPCKPGDAKQKWIQKGKSLISKASRECIAASGMSSYLTQCYSLSLVRCDKSDLDQQWTSTSKGSNFHNAKFDIVLSTNSSSGSEVHACSRSAQITTIQRGKK